MLREAGLVTETVERQSRRYRLRPEGLREVETWLEPYRRFWTRRLDDLGHLLDTTDESEQR
ncbi:hypothetical protein ABT336_20205 [Micromonospora sp. NPDC000207]|uniref:hypothetical protein n=1 Tax=Micromonospora sp. NPDC000207 TaxID=3154246 RepID=UPI00332B32BB